ncbi:tubulin--tyrosine ligase-like protein 12, partial [Plakobranchus ocellatus]
NDIFIMLRELFQAATSLPSPKGIHHSPQSRAMYAVDLMLTWDTKPSGEKVMQPMLCEVNFSPDCARACKYHPFFANDVFSILFLDDVEDKHVVPL